MRLVLLFSFIYIALPARAVLPRITRPPHPLVYSEGYVFGRAYNPSLMGVTKKFFASNIMLGFTSVAAPIVNERCYEHTLGSLESHSGFFTRRERLEARAREECSESFNPFPVNSYRTSWFEVFRKIADRISIFRFKSYVTHPLLDYPHVIQSVWAIKPFKKNMPKSIDEDSLHPLFRNLRYGVAQDDGHVVLASEDGYVRRRFRIVMQQGEGTGTFAELEVPSRRLFEYIIECMHSGRSIRVYYYHLFNIESLPGDLVFGYRTNTRVYRVDLLD